MKFIILLLISIVIYVNGYSHNNMRLVMKTSSLPKKYNEKIKNGIRNAVALTSFSLILNPKAMAAVLSDEERQLQQNQKPDSLSAQITYVGKKPDFQKIRKELDELIQARPEKGTYDKMTKSGGSGKGTIRFKTELDHGANAGLDNAINWLEPIYKKYSANADLSYADLYTLGGIQAIKSLGGPDIKWQAGRVDSYNEKDATPDGRLPDADKGDSMKTAAGLRNIFYRMGFNDQEIVALSGAHALGRCHITASGYVGPWTFTPTTFNNQYFVLLKGLKWEPNPKASKFQYQDPSGKLMMLPSDIVLIEDEKFKQYVDIYAKDQKKFFADFSDAFSRLLSLGCSNLYDV